MAYLDSHGLGTLWNKIKSHFGKSLELNKSATAVDIKLKNAASTPDVLSTITLPAAGTNNQAGVMTSAQAAKLDGIAAGAEVNVQPNWDETDSTSDAYIRNKPVIPDGAVIYHNLGQNTDGAIDQKVVTDELNAKEITSNKVAAWSSTTTDTHYPSEKLVKSSLDNKVDKVSGKGLSTNDYTTTEKNKLAGIEANANNYVHPTTSGNKHIPSGGSSGKILGWSADGTAAWIDAPDTGVTKITAGTNVSISPTGGTGNVTINATDTTYESKAAASGGSAVSLCTTGEKYTWNNKQSALSTAQLNACNSGITSSKVSAYDGYASSKQDVITFNTAYNASTNKAATMSDINSAVVGHAKYCGTLAKETDLTGLTNFKQGNYWVVSTGWTSSSMGLTFDVGNMIFANADGSTFAAAKFDVIQADIEAIPDSEINALS